MTFAQRRNRLKTHFWECIPVVKRRMTVRLQKLESTWQYKQTISLPAILHKPRKLNLPDFQASTKHSIAFLPHLLLSYYWYVESFLQLLGCQCWDYAVQMTFPSTESPKTEMYVQTPGELVPNICGYSFWNFVVDLSSWTLLLQQPTQCTNSLVYFSSLPYMFRALIQLVIKRLCTMWQMVIVSLNVDYGPGWSSSAPSCGVC
jgi:hypothetical protein